MKFAFISPGDYQIGQIIDVHGKQMQVESYAHTGRNIVVHTLPDAPKFERVVCIVTVAEPITGVTAAPMAKNLLNSYERGQLAHFIQQSKEGQAQILADARADSHVSGPLIHAYCGVLNLI